MLRLFLPVHTNKKTLPMAEKGSERLTVCLLIFPGLMVPKLDLAPDIDT